jgi:hypothetical protein
MQKQAKLVIKNKPEPEFLDNRVRQVRYKKDFAAELGNGVVLGE